jgi:hypothetical protein
VRVFPRHLDLDFSVSSTDDKNVSPLTFICDYRSKIIFISWVPSETPTLVRYLLYLCHKIVADLFVVVHDLRQHPRAP